MSRQTSCGVDDDILDGLFGRGSQTPRACITALVAESIRYQDLIVQAVAYGNEHVIKSLAETASEKLTEALAMIHQEFRNGERN
jgi:hypothetical protein